MEIVSIYPSVADVLIPGQKFEFASAHLLPDAPN